MAAASTGGRPLRLHVGHHFYGAGNIGDDLMMAGFLRGIGADDNSGRAIEITCATPFADVQRGRFPAVRWLPYDAVARAAAVAGADAWVGVGGSPFQLSVGTWFYDHLAQELDFCRRLGKPMFLLGVGVNEREALSHPAARAVLEYASHTWTRDDTSAEWIGDISAAGRVTPAADLAHVELARRTFDPPEPDVSAYVLNFEDLSQFSSDAFCAQVERSPGRHRWLVQEVRPLDGSETRIHAALPEACRARLADVRVPAYAMATTAAQLVDAWGVPGRLLTSRYHASIVGAWIGSRVLIVCRSDKLRGAAKQLGAASVDALLDPDAVRKTWDAARPVERERLAELAQLAEQSCAELLQRVC